MLGGPGRGIRLGKGAEVRRELSVRNFSAKFLSIRQAAASTALGWRRRMGVAAWFQLRQGEGLTRSLRSAGLAPALRDVR